MADRQADAPRERTVPPVTTDLEARESVAGAGTPSVLCEVFRSPRREGMYLYVDRAEGLSRVPEDLLQRFGTPESALVFRLHAQRTLARVSAPDVLAALAEAGFYLQMPPGPGATESGKARGRALMAASDAQQEEPPC